MYSKVARLTLAIVAVLTGVGAGAGGIGLLVGWIALPTEWLQGSLFSSYMIPGLALAILVGGSSLLSAGMLLVHHPLGALTSLAAGLLLVFFEVVEFVVVHYVSWMQPFFFGVGLLTLVLAGLLWRAEWHYPIPSRSATEEERQLTGSSR